MVSVGRPETNLPVKQPSAADGQATLAMFSHFSHLLQPGRASKLRQNSRDGVSPCPEFCPYWPRVYCGTNGSGATVREFNVRLNY